MSNTLTNVLDKILARGLMTLRERAMMPNLVLRDYETEARMQGDTINIPVPQSKVAQDVTPSPTHSSGQNSTFGNVAIQLDNWKHADFFLSDKEQSEIVLDRHFMPMNAAEAIKALANAVDVDVHDEYVGIYGFVGTAGVNPFSTLATVTNTRKTLNQQLAPVDPRHMLLDPTAEAQALLLDPLRDMEKTGDGRTPIEGELGRKMGFNWFMTQNAQTHTAGTLVTPTGLIGSTTAAGASTVGIKSASAVGNLLIGDVFTIAGDTQTYVVLATVSAIASGTQKAVRIAPPLQETATANDAVTVKATHTVNLAFNTGCFALATRPLRATSGLGSVIRSITDPMTGLSLRLELSRQNKMEQFDFDILWGAKLVRPELGVRIAG